MGGVKKSLGVGIGARVEARVGEGIINAGTEEVVNTDNGPVSGHIPSLKRFTAGWNFTCSTASCDSSLAPPSQPASPLPPPHTYTHTPAHLHISMDTADDIKENEEGNG